MVAEDTSHITGQLTPDQIGEAIRHKKFGTDMREAIAQAFEYMQGFYEIATEVEKNINNLRQRHNADVETINQELSSISSQLESAIEQHNSDIADVINRINSTNDRVSQNTESIAKLRTDFDNHIQEENKRWDDYEKRVKKLEDAVFNAIYVNDTAEKIEDNPSKSSFINDTHSADDDNGLIINEDNYTLPYDIN